MFRLSEAILEFAVRAGDASSLQVFCHSECVCILYTKICLHLKDIWKAVKMPEFTLCRKHFLVCLFYDTIFNA